MGQGWGRMPTVGDPEDEELICHMRSADGFDDTYWAATAAPLGALPTYSNTLETDILVIGAGFTGLSTALHLAETGANVVVLDEHEPGWGASGRNHGQIVAGLKHEPHEIENDFGLERGRRLIKAIGLAPDLVFELIRRYAISCNATRNGILTAANSSRGVTALKKRVEIWQARNVPLVMLSRAEAQDRIGTTYYLGACFDPRGGSINPLAYARGLAAAASLHGARIASGVKVETISAAGGRWIAKTSRGSVTANKVVIATNGYTGDFWPGLKRTFLPVKTPQLVTQPLPPEVCARVLAGRETMSDTRSLTLGARVHPDNRLHFGGATATGGQNIEGVYRDLATTARQVFPFLPELKWDYKWTGIMAMTPSRYPYLLDLAPGIVACLGYSGRGIGMATMLGREVAAWARGAQDLNDLALPVSRGSYLPYYDLRAMAVNIAVQYYRARDNLLRG